MKKLLLATALAVAIAAPAHAGPTVPEQFRGTWCRAIPSGKMMIYGPSNLAPCVDDDSIMTIKPDRYDGWEHGCRFTAVKTSFDPKSRGTHISRVDASCGGEGCTWREQLTIYEAKGALYVTRRHFGERCHD